MLRFYLLRHAKSSWAEPGRPDFERSLSARGADDLVKIAATLREKSYLPGHVYCSPSLRTRLTLHGLMSAFDQPPSVDYDETLYSGSLTSYFDCLHRHSGTEALMIIGHNPMCEAFSMALASSGDSDAMARMKAKFPTGSLAVFDMNTDDWSKVERGSGHLVDFIVPKEL